MDVPKEQITTLLEHGLYTSAQTLVFFISHFPYKINFHFFTLRFQFRFTLIRLICLNQGCFLVSSPAANAETSPHIKAESLVWIFFFFNFNFHFFPSNSKFSTSLFSFSLLFPLQVLLSDALFREREYRRAIVRTNTLRLNFF